MVKKTGKYMLLVCALLWCTVSFGQKSEINASSSRTTVGLNEPFRVTYSTSEGTGQFRVPKFKNFQVVSGPYTSQQTQFINGSRSFSKKMSFDIVATKKGVFNLATATMLVKGRVLESNSLKIEVKAEALRENTSTKKSKASFEVEILTSKKSVYVGEPLVLLFRAVLFDQVRDLTILQQPNFENVLQQQLDFKQTSKRESVSNRTATLLDFDKRLVIPNKPGTLKGQSLQISAKVQVPSGRRDFFGMPMTNFVAKVATGKIPSVIIKPLPSPKPEDYSGGIGDLNFVRELSRKEVNGNESITLKIRIEGIGNFNTLSVPHLVEPQGFDVYDPKFNENIRYTERGVRGYKEFEYLLVPQFKGTFILPEMTWVYFNTSKERYETITASADTLVVVGGAPSKTHLTNDLGVPLTKREVNAIDDDIRYLQQGEYVSDQAYDLKSWSWTVVGLMLLGWGVQVIPRKKVKGGSTSRKKELQKLVETAFDSAHENRFGIMLNSLEERFLELGIAKENTSLEEITQLLGDVHGLAVHQLIERCQIAQYAPSASSGDHELLTEFTRLWNNI